MSHLSPGVLSRLAEGGLPQPELLDALRHLGECGECARAATAAHAPEDEQAVRRALALAPADEHLDYDTQLLPYVEKRAGAAEREIIATHLLDCATCAAEVADLAEMPEVARPTRRRRVWPVALAAAAAAVIGGVSVAVFRAPDAPPPRVVQQEPAPAARPVPPPAVTPPESPRERARYEDPRWNTLVTAAIAGGRLPLSPLLARLNPPAEVLRGAEDEEHRVLAPAGVVLDEPRPRFRWTAVEGATYEVAVFDGDRRVADSGTLTRAEWRPFRSLPRGRTYVWQVTVARGDKTEILPSPAAPRALFHIITAAQQHAISEAQARHPDDFLLHAILFAEAGMQSEAKAALGQAVAAGNADAKKIRSPHR
jgi:hypothetical protein